MPEMGRPTKYDRKYIKEVDDYLAECKDEYKMIEDYKESEGVKLKEEELKGSKIKWRKKGLIKVKLPTIEGLALRLDVSKKTLYNWSDKHEDFLHALRKIEKEQKQRVLEMSLAGEYNPNIAKLILSANHGMKERSDITTDDKAIQIAGNSIKIEKYGDRSKTESK